MNLKPIEGDLKTMVLKILKESTVIQESISSQSHSQPSKIPSKQEMTEDEYCSLAEKVMNIIMVNENFQNHLQVLIQPIVEAQNQKLKEN